MSSVHCLESRDFDAARLAASHPPVWKHPLKQRVHEFVCEKAGAPDGLLRLTRWGIGGFPDKLWPRLLEVEVEPDVYLYGDSDCSIWHVNFADPDLFVAYGSALLAQDELQALEHPVLGSVREAMCASGRPPRTRESNRSTPILIAGAPRQCALDTFPDLDQGRPRGLYGNRFQEATWEAVRSALTVLQPPTITNLICIAAPTGSGQYTEQQVRDALETACTGMMAARSETLGKARKRVEVHTGFWGCGAFGGNRTLMSLLQLLAARIACIDRLVFYTGTQSDVIAFEKGRAILDRILAELNPEPYLEIVISEIVGQRFIWGASDGN